MSSTTPSTLAERDSRQRDLIPPDRLAGCHALVIGVGAIGRQVALQLAAIGMPKMTLFDDDVVGPENLAPQGYWEEDVGTSKVGATAALCRRLNTAVQMIGHTVTYTTGTATKTGTVESVQNGHEGPTLTIGGAAGITESSVTGIA